MFRLAGGTSTAPLRPIYSWQAPAGCSRRINAMQKLTPAYRTVFNLYVFEELTHKEIAEMLGINIGTSKSNLAKAKHNLIKLAG